VKWENKAIRKRGAGKVFFVKKEHTSRKEKNCKKRERDCNYSL
jgi:hypothetical protein